MVEVKEEDEGVEGREAKRRAGATRTVGTSPGGGQTKLPPTRIQISACRIAAGGCQNQLATTLAGEFWIASSR